VGEADFASDCSSLSLYFLLCISFRITKNSIESGYIRDPFVCSKTRPSMQSCLVSIRYEASWRQMAGFGRESSRG
jgi:hypothetical protein